MKQSKWVCLSINPSVEFELHATEVHGVYSTEEITVTRKGTVLGTYGHVRIDEREQLLVIYDIAARRDTGLIGHFIAIN